PHLRQEFDGFFDIDLERKRRPLCCGDFASCVGCGAVRDDDDPGRASVARTLYRRCCRIASADVIKLLVHRTARVFHRLLNGGVAHPAEELNGAERPRGSCCRKLTVLMPDLERPHRRQDDRYVDLMTENTCADVGSGMENSRQRLE